MSFGDTNAICVKDRHTKLANCLRGKSNPSRHSPKERQCRRLPQSLVIDSDGEVSFADSSDDFAQGFVRARVRLPNLRCQCAALDQLFPARMRQPNDFSIREGLAQAGNGGKCVDDISERAKTHYQETRLRHAAPCERIRGILALNDPWGHLRWPRACLAA